MDSKHKARGQAAKAAVTGIYKKSRTKGLDKPDASSRGAAAFELLNQIREAREWAKFERKGLAEHIDNDFNRTTSIGKKFIRAKSSTKVNAHRQVQALKQAYDKLPESEKDAGRKTMMREAKKGPVPLYHDRQDSVRKRLDKHMSHATAIDREFAKGKKKSQ